MTINQRDESPEKSNDECCSFVATYSLGQGKKLGNRANNAACEQMGQIGRRIVLEPTMIEDLAEEE